MRKCIATVNALLGRHIEWQKHAWISMSSYLQSLDEESKRRYSQKLTGMLGGIEDPYGFNKGDSVKCDERLWPCVCISHDIVPHTSNYSAMKYRFTSLILFAQHCSIAMLQNCTAAKYDY